MKRFLACALVWWWCSVASAGEPIVIDDPAATITRDDNGGFESITWETSNYGGTWKYYGYAGDPDGAGELRYRFTVTAGKEYKVYVTWAATSYNTTGGRAVVGTVTHDYISTTPPVADLTVGGRPFQHIATVTASGATLDVFLRHRMGVAFGADAVAIVEQEPPPPIPPGVVVRDDAAASYVGSWTNKTDWATPFFGSGARFSAVASAEAPQYYEHVFSAAVDAVYQLYWCYPTGDAEYDTNPQIRLIYTNYANQAVDYTTGPQMSFQAAINPEGGIVVDGMQFGLKRGLIGVKAGTTVRVRVSATIGKRIISDAVAFKAVYGLNGEPFEEEELPPGEEDDGQDDPPPPGDDGPPTSGGNGPGEPIEGDPWGVFAGEDEYTHGTTYPAPWHIIVGPQVLGSHVAVQTTLSFSGGDGPYPAKRVQAWVNGHWHMARTYDHREIQIGGRLDPEADAGSGVDYFHCIWTVRVGRNGYMLVSLTDSDGYTPIQRLPVGETYILAAIDYLLSDAEKLPVAVSGTPGIVQDASDLYGVRWESITRAFLEALRSGLVERKDWRVIIPRSPDQSFDPVGGGGVEGDWPSDLDVSYESFEWQDPTTRYFEPDEQFSKLFGWVPGSVGQREFELEIAGPTTGYFRLPIYVNHGILSASIGSLWDVLASARVLVRVVCNWIVYIGATFYVISRLQG